jgi:hypothetical protein
MSRTTWKRAARRSAPRARRLREYNRRIELERTLAADPWVQGVALIPFVGGLVGLAAVVFGSGALLLTIASARRSNSSTVSHSAQTSLPNLDKTVEPAIP